jgi:hypothetical protein
MNPKVRAQAWLTVGLVLCLAILGQRGLEARKSALSVETALLVRQSQSGAPGPSSVLGPSAGTLPLESPTDNLFGRSTPQSVAEARPIKVPDFAPPPTFPYRYLGRVQAKHYLERDGQLIPIDVGTPLQDGFEILTVDERQIIARHKPTGLPVTISLPTQRE